MDLDFLGNTFLRLLSGLPLTIELAALSIAAGSLLAFLLTAIRLLNPVGEWAVRAYVWCFRGSPLLVQMYLIYYGLGQFPIVRQSVFWAILRQPFWCAVIALSLCSAAYIAEILRGGLSAVPPGAVAASRACGMSTITMYRRVILPLAVRQAIPAYGNEVIIIVKATSLASVITLMEITGLSRVVISESYRALEVFVSAGAIYLAMTFLLSRGVEILENALNPLASR